MNETNPFLRHVVTMLTGTAFAQLIPLLASPILTRLYSPSDFGVLSAVLAAAGLITILGTLRYELAIVLPKDEKSAANLFAIATIPLMTLCVLAAILIFAFPASSAWLFPKASQYVVAIPILALFVALTQVMSFSANRERLYRTIAAGSVLQQAGTAIIAIGIGLAAFAVNGLILGRIFGYVIACTYYTISLWGFLERWRDLAEKKTIVETAVTYRQFPLFSLPYSLIGSFSREFLVFAFTAMTLFEAAGSYGLARTILTAPIGLLSAAISQVYYKEAAVSIGSARFKHLTLSSFRYFAVSLAPFFVFGWFWAPDAFQLVFGENWRDAGTYASVLMPIGYLSLFTSWPERVFEVRGKQHLSLTIQLIFDSITVAAVSFSLFNGSGPLGAVKCYVIIQFAYHLTYLAAVFRLSGFDTIEYMKFILLSSGAIGTAVLIEFIAFNSVSPLWLQFAVSVVAASALSLALVLLLRRSTRSESGSST